MTYPNLRKYGLTEQFEEEATAYEDLFLARVSEQHRELYKVIGEQGESNAVVSGKFTLHTDGPSGFPAVGDFVMIDRQDDAAGNAVIHFNLRRTERYLTLVWDSEAKPVIVLTESDLCDDIDAKLQELSSVAFGVDIVVCSSENADGLDAYAPRQCRSLCRLVRRGKVHAHQSAAWRRFSCYQRNPQG